MTLTGVCRGPLSISVSTGICQRCAPSLSRPSSSCASRWYAISSNVLQSTRASLRVQGAGLSVCRVE
eukprot:2232088-Rhodomonas_salina.1